MKNRSMLCGNVCLGKNPLYPIVGDAGFGSLRKLASINGMVGMFTMMEHAYRKGESSMELWILWVAELIMVKPW